ncbi:MAG TPA: hypothetical protein VKT76_01530 [Bradyrhizobium sp.]|nr:hypothetical protein [Bradyrhizobium sp.]
MDFLLASAMLIAGLAISGLSLVSIARTDVHLAQGTPPIQVTPPSENNAPAEAKPGGTRPTTPAPEPATPTAKSQQEGAKAALPPAPPEKIAPPLEKK